MTPGKRMRYTGRSSGDLVFWIEDDDLEGRAKELERRDRSVVEFPRSIDQPHPLVRRRIRAAVRRGAELDRKDVLIHLLATGFERRGYTVTGDENEIAASSADGFSFTYKVGYQTDRVPDLDRKGQQKTNYFDRPQWKRIPNGKVQVDIVAALLNCGRRATSV